MIHRSKRPLPVQPPHQAIRAQARRRERWRDLGAALGIATVAVLVRLLLPGP